MKTNHLLLALLPTVGLASLSSAAVVVQWAPEGNNTAQLTTSGTDAAGNSLFIDPAFSFVDQTGTYADNAVSPNPTQTGEYGLGSGAGYKNISEGGYAGSTATNWSANDINLESGATNRASAINNNQYFSYIVNSANATTITDITFDVWLNGGGSPDIFAIYTTIGGGALTQAGSDFDFSSSSARGDAGSGDPTLLGLDASGLSLNVGAGQDVEVRLYFWDGGGDEGNFHITGGNLSVIPEPSHVALGMGVLALLFLQVRRRMKR